MIVRLGDREIKLRLLNDPDYNRAERLARVKGPALDTCPTCGSKERYEAVQGGVRVRDRGTYRLWGEEHECDCTTQIALRARYLLANIGEQYMRLDWKDYNGPEEIKDKVKLYLDKWESFKLHGMGIEFGGKGLGVGKTFGATYIGRELIKRGQRVFFISFAEMVSAFEKEDGEDIERRMRDATYLILDELLPPSSERQHNFYATRLEALIRHRTNHNLPTIITTNLTEEELHEDYPRTYSLLAAKQLRIDMSGVDARKNKIAEENINLAANEEVRPIT